jgi:uncharacterized protein (TIGR02466 family)
MIIQNIFTNFLAIDTLSIDNLDMIEQFCYEKIKIEPSDPGQSNMSELELDTLFLPIKQQIEYRLEEIKKEFEFKNNLSFKIGRIWINLNQNNNVTRPHLHSNSLLSGVLYIKCKDSGPIVFMHPVMAHQYVISPDTVKKFNMFNSADISVTPEVGKLIIFPSWLVHYVENNLDYSDRISIAFNIKVIEN